jgi:ribosomal protein S18 acetylase RimI-like enzyme
MADSSEPTREEKIADALRAAPACIADAATIVDWDMTTVLRELPRRMAMPAAEISFERLDYGQAAAHMAELQSLHDEVYVDAPPVGDDFPSRLRVHIRQPGFVLEVARSGGYLIGYAAGMPLRPSTSWWRQVTTTLPEQVTAEYPGRTFALVELLVRGSWRRQGIGRSLHDLILTGRPEERATVVVPPTAAAAQAAFQNWGWHKIARARNRAGLPASDVLLTALPDDREPLRRELPTTRAGAAPTEGRPEPHALRRDEHVSG